MNKRKYFKIVVSLMVLTSLLFGGNIKATAMPARPVDESKVPHYFGPYPHWANSPFTLADAQVLIIGNGSGAEAVATVGAQWRCHRHHHNQPRAQLFECTHG